MLKSIGLKMMCSAVCLVFVFFVVNPGLCQEKTQDLEKKYAEIIGDYEFERAESMFFLAKNGIPVRIWGSNWGRKCRLRHGNMVIENRPLWGEDYAKGICTFDYKLSFLRKIKRDLQTTRSVEIPACGAFMLAERTNENLKLL